MSENQLIHQAVSGDADAFGQLVRTYQDRLFTSIGHLIGDASLAEDVVQDAFVQAYVKLDTFQGKSSFYTWLYRIAFHIAINHRRQQKPAVSVEQNSETLGQMQADHSDCPSDQLERQERTELIQQALTTLSDDYRAVLVLREIEGCDYQTIASITNVSVGTVRSRLYRARALMREAIVRAERRSSPTD
jgi:RNA polymerase sigma-70 factor (ECF subfamily)